MNLYLLLLIVLPFIAGLLVLFPGRYVKILRWIFALGGVIGSGLFIILNIINPGATIEFRFLTQLNSIQFTTSPVTLVLGLTFTFLWFIVVLYSFGYFKKDTEADTEYYALTLFMLGSMYGLLYTNNLLFLYLFWEIAALTTWRLVGFERTEKTISIATKTIIVNFFGSALMLVGFTILALAEGSLNFNLFAMKGLSIPISAGVLILAGIFAKSAVIPLYIWLPDAHPAAPSPMSALLSGAIVKIGLIAYFKIFVETFNNLTPAWYITIMTIVLVSSLVAGGAALIGKDPKRILAFSTVSQMAFIFAGFIVVIQLTGSLGGILYLMAHCLAKGGLFLGYGVVIRQTGKRDIKDLGGLVKGFPILFTSIMIFSLSIIGLPPLFGFFGKIDVLLGVLGIDLIVPNIATRLLIGGGFILASVLTLLYMLRLFSAVFLRTANGKESGTIREPLYLSLVVLVLSLSIVGAGIGMKPLIAYLAGG